MFKINHVPPDKAEGQVAEAYGVFPQGFPPPAPFQLMSASPGLMDIQTRSLRYFMTHPTLDTGLLAMIRYAVAQHICYDFCVGLNAHLLKAAAGMSEKELATLRDNPENAPLEEEQKALLLFVLKVVKTPREVTQEDVQTLRGLGWSDQDIFDAAFHASSMQTSNTLMAAFGK